MNCLILAAGHGSRLREVSLSKPLTPIAGVPLIERVMRSALAAGATDFTVATGHRAVEVEAFLTAIGQQEGCNIGFARLDDWDKPNGHSVLAGAAFIEGPFLLLMSDHLFDPEIARRAVAAGEASGAALTLAIDRDWQRESLDLEDATKVALDGERIVAIGKDLTRFDAVDTGVFYARPALVSAIAAAEDSGKAGSLSEGVQQLADHGLARIADVTGLMWLDVDDPAALAKAATLFKH